ncbi:hypothetical protein ACLOJK_019473 [Asimina triloba]
MRMGASGRGRAGNIPGRLSGRSTFDLPTRLLAPKGSLSSDCSVSGITYSVARSPQVTRLFIGHNVAYSNILGLTYKGRSPTKPLTQVRPLGYLALDLPLSIPITD